MPNETTLQLSSDFGKQLIEAATETRKRELSAQCVGEVQSVMQHIENQRTARDRAESNLKLFEARLAAIEAGQVKFVQGRQGGMIVYENPELGDDKVR